MQCASYPPGQVVISSSELEYLKSLRGLGTEEEEGYRTGPPGYMAGAIHSLESIPGPHTRLKIRTLVVFHKPVSMPTWVIFKRGWGDME